MFKKTTLYTLSFLLSLFSLVLIHTVYIGILARNQKIVLPDVAGVANAQTQFYPTKLMIDSAEIELPIALTTIIDGNWNYSDKEVLFVKDSGGLGMPGNKIFYGHNYPNLLKNLKNVTEGDTIEFFQAGSIYRYKVVSANNVTPDQTHIMSQTDDDRVTIFTCSGFLDSKRLVITAVKI